MKVFHRIDGSRDLGGTQGRRSLRSFLLTAARLFAALVVFPILLGAAVLSLMVNSSRGDAYLIDKVQKKAEESLGVAVHLQNFNLHFSSLSADLYGITVDGAGPHSNPPLLQLQHAAVGIRVVSVLGNEWYFDNIRLDNPVAQIFIDKNGVSNLPSLNSNGSSNTSVFDLGIRHAVLANGAVFCNNRPNAIAFDVHDLQFNARFDKTLVKYSGTLGYSDGNLNYAGTQLPPHKLNIQFDATPRTFHLSSVQVQSGKSSLMLNATVDNYAAPVVQAHYQAVVDGAQLADTLRNPSIPSGLVSISGNAQYQTAAGRPALQNLVVNGDLTSRELIAATPSIHGKIANIVSHYSLANGDATVRDFQASLLNGEVTAHGTMKNISGDSRSKFDATVRAVSLAEARRVLSGASTGPVSVTGTLNATATAAWGKTFDDLVAHTDTTIHARVSGKAQTMVSITQTPGSSPPSPSTGTFPIEGALHATYMGKTQQLAFDHSYLHSPQTNLNLNGTVSKSSNLVVQFQANDLREIESIADLFRTAPQGQPIQSLGLSGGATFSGVVSGSTSAPQINGQLAAQGLHVQGTSWKVFRANLHANPSEVSLQRVELDSSKRGHLALNASVQLHRWSFSKSSPLQLQLSANQFDVGELARLAGQQIPVTGTLAADIKMHGSILEPEGTGAVTVSNGAAYGETISSAKVTFSGNGDQASANFSISAPAGTMEAKLVSSINNKTYSAELTSSGIHLDKLQSLQKTNLDLTGVVRVSAKGQGTFEDPQLEANIDIPTLILQKQIISDIRLHANLANHEAAAQLTSSAVNTSIKANARVALTGDYLADATLDTQGIPLGPLIATYAPDQAENVTGQTEVHATLHGPLKNRHQLEAHVTIPVLKLAYSNTVQLAAVAPIQIDYKDETISVQRSSIRGTDTDLQFQGTIPMAGNAPMSLMLIGSVDLHLAQLLNPDLRTSGHIKFNINSYGATHGPEIAGTVDVVDAALATPDLPVGLQHCNGTLQLTKDRLNITQLKGDMGGGTLTAQGGVALRPSIQFDMGVAASNVRMLYPQGMREAISANIRLTGTPQAALLGGNVNLADLSFTPAFDPSNFINQLTGGVETPPSQGFAQNVALNLMVHSSNNVNLVSRTLSIGGSANLQVRGTAAEPVILGRANLTGGDIILNGNRFVLAGGTIQFVNPSVTQPIANLTITTSIQQYNISLRFEGPVDQLRTQYSSDPALPSADIIHLLAFGQTTESSAVNATPANQAAETLVANQVSSQVTSRISKVAGISQLSINPVLAGGNSQGPAGANITVQQRVTGNLFVTFSTNVQTTQGQTIQGQYQVSPRVAVSATRDPNGGFAVDTLIKKTW